MAKPLWSVKSGAHSCLNFGLCRWACQLILPGKVTSLLLFRKLFRALLCTLDLSKELMNLSPYIALGIGEDVKGPFFCAGVGGRVFKLLGSESGLEPKWQCHFGCECLPTYSLQVQAQQVPKCTQTSRKWNGQSSKAFPFCSGKVAMCQMFWFQNSLLVQLGMSQHNI